MSILAQNDKAEPKSLLDLPVTELAKLCQDPAILLATLSIAYQHGYKIAQEQCHRHYHMMLAGNDEKVIKD